MPMVPQHYWSEVTNLSHLWFSMLVTFSSVETLSELKVIEYHFTAPFICFSKVSWCTPWFIILKNNCLDFGKNSRNFNVNLIGQRNSDGVEP